MENLTKSELYSMKQKIEKMLTSDHSKDDLKINVFVKQGKKLENSKWLFLFQDTEFLLAKALTSNACKIIMMFRAICKYENRVDYSATQIAKILDVSRQSVYRGVKELKDAGIVIEFKDELDERRNVYYLNPESQWKGTVAKMTGVKAIFDQNGKFQDFKDSKNPKQLDLLDEIGRQSIEEE